VSELSFLAVHAHPDDESITMGGTLARYASEGIRTTLVTATRGEVGEILDKDLDPKEAAPRLASIREAELRAACGILGVGELVFLGYEDSGMMGEARNQAPKTFWQADEMEAVGRLVAIVRRVKPQVIATYNEIGGYGHPDHIRTHRVAVMAFHHADDLKLFPEGEPHRPSKLYYSAFPKSQLRAIGEAMKRAGMEERFGRDDGEAPFAVDDERVTALVDVGDQLERKLQAMLAHRTQIPPDSWFMKLRDVLGPRAWSKEAYERVRSRVDAPTREDDLFAGLR
jgi:N-acetyl-1-D-myo-inositol-2-amino-2-deoxy-alpha-D-glucopyranoside deacetylase